MPRLILYSRADGHLCEDMFHELQALREELELVIETRDVDCDPHWRRRYGEWVPVLMLGERKICHYHLDHDALLAVLAGR
jgi:hypothetical protein